MLANREAVSGASRDSSFFLIGQVVTDVELSQYWTTVLEAAVAAGKKALCVHMLEVTHNPRVNPSTGLFELCCFC